MEIKNTIKHNVEVLQEYVKVGELGKAAVILELLCLQIKMALGQKVVCTVNRDSIKKNAPAAEATEAKQGVR